MAEHEWITGVISPWKVGFFQLGCTARWHLSTWPWGFLSAAPPWCPWVGVRHSCATSCGEIAWMRNTGRWHAPKQVHVLTCYAGCLVACTQAPKHVTECLQPHAPKPRIAEQDLEEHGRAWTKGFHCLIPWVDNYFQKIILEPTSPSK